MDNIDANATASADLCDLCNVRPRQYTCPRCGKRYCNIECYKSEAHLECSESFYRQCVEEELKSQETDVEGRQKMVEILKRIHAQEFDDISETDYALEENELELDSDDDDVVPNLEERLQNVNLDDADKVWSALVDSERQEFEALIKNGEAEKLLPPWVPWWTHGVKKKLIREINEETVDYTRECPALIDVPIFDELQKASPNVCFNLTNVIYAYAYMALYYNGDYLNCAEEAAIIFLDICENMKTNKVYECAEAAIDSVVQKVTSYDWLPRDEQTMSALKEAGTTIMYGPEETNETFYISVALSELYRLFTLARKEISKQKSEHRSSEFSKKFVHENYTNNFDLSKKTLLLGCKKLEYYLSWIKMYGKNVSISSK